jgi:hypothetical protein
VPICLTAMIIFGMIGAIYLLISGTRASYVSGFRFYLVATLIQSLSVLSLLSMALLVKEVPPWMYALGLAVPIAYYWRIWQENRVRRTDPSRWRVWVDRVTQAKQSATLDRFLLPAVRKTGYDDDTR